MKIKAAVCYEPNDPYVIETVDLEAEPKADEVLVRNVSASMCLTDEAGRAGYVATLPIVLGHEGSGIIEKVGSNIKHLAPGDHVVLGRTYCGECRSCKMGHFSNCELIPGIMGEGKMLDGTTRISKDGKPINSFYGMAGFSEYSVCHHHVVTKVDEDVDLKMLSPLACGIITGAGTVINYLKPQAHESIVVVGCGSVGISAIMGAKIAGCKNIIGVEIIPEKAEKAKEFGATHVICNEGNVDFADQVREITGYGVEYFVDTTGDQTVIDNGFKALARMGTMVMLAIAPEMKVSPIDMVIGGLNVAGVSAGYAKTQDFIPEMVRYHKEGRFPFEKMITYYPFEEINQAVEDLHAGKIVKAVLTF